MQKHVNYGLALLLLFGLFGCSVQQASWSGGIEDVPPISVDDPQKNGNTWFWQDKQNRWHYRDSDKVQAEYMSWDFESQAIVFRFHAPQQLNMYVGKPHSLFLRVFQLSGLKVFDEIRKTPAGVQELLSEKDIDASILSSTDVYVAPNEIEKIAIDRHKATRFVAVVAGYYGLDPAETVRVFQVPSVSNREEELNFTVADINPFATPAASEAARIKAWVDLGVTKISRLQMVAE